MNKVNFIPAFILLSIILIIPGLLLNSVYSAGLTDLKVHYDMSEGDSWINTAGHVGIGTTSPNAQLHVAGTDGALFTGMYNSGTIPAEGAGVRVMWYPKKAAFRAGFVNNQQWNDANIGNFSTALGYSTTASGVGAVALGYNTNADQAYSTALGYGTSASGYYSTSAGMNTNAGGYASAAMNYLTNASGNFSTSMGYETTSQAYGSLVIGRNNEISGTTNSWVSTEPVFVIGNGDTSAARSNALTVLKNGSVGIGTSAPSAGLHVTKDAGALFTGTFGSGVIPVEGAGIRMMWYPKKAAFRSGFVNSQQWNDVNIGDFSFAAGHSTTASGFGSSALGVSTVASASYSTAIGNNTEANMSYSFASGSSTIASGLSSVAMGISSEASGDHSAALGRETTASGHASTSTGYRTLASGADSIAMGMDTIASGSISTVMGRDNMSSGDYSATMGRYVTAQSSYSLAIGRYNEISGSTSSWYDTDPLFVVGNGDDESNRANALTVLKNGKVGIGSSSPSHTLTLQNDTDHNVLNLIGPDSLMGDGARLNFGIGDLTFIEEDEDNSLYIYSTGRTSLMGGKVGIGTLSPLRELDVEGDIGISKFPIQKGTSTLLFGKTILGQNDFAITHNHGNNWTARPHSAQWKSVAVSSNGKIQTAVFNGNVYVSTDYGSSWLPKGVPADLRSVAMSADGKYQAAVEYNGRIYISNDYGNTWAQKYVTRYWISVAMSSDGKKQTAVEKGGAIHISSNYGESWLPKSVNGDWETVVMSADGSVQAAVDYAGQIYVSTDSGDTWSPKSTNRNWRSIDMSADGSIMTAVVYGGWIYVSTDYGNTWSAKDSSRAWWCVAMSADGSIQTAGVLGDKLYVSNDYGNTWSPHGTNEYWYSVAMSADGNVQAAVDWDSGQIYVSFSETSFLGSTGIDTRNPDYTLEVNGSAGKPGGGTWSNSSDIRLKENIKTINGKEALDKISRLRGVTFKWINQEEHEYGLRAGVIAQELEKVFPDWVNEIDPGGNDKYLVPAGKKVKSISFPHDFNAYLIEAIKELKANVDQKDIEIKQLNERLSKLEKE